MWAIVITNQGAVVHHQLAADRDALEVGVKQACADWGLDHTASIHVAARPVSTMVSTVTMKTHSARVDNLKDPKYVLTVTSVKGQAKEGKGAKTWQFCPDCGCSWLHHLEGPANLAPSDWEARACTQCGCEKAVNP